MLIDTREQHVPEDERESVEPDWRLWLWVVSSVAFFIAATSVTGPLGSGAALVGFTAAMLALERFTGRYGSGLQEGRQ